MSNEESRETIEKLLKSAKKEFIEKGYMKASLRNICKDSGVTTGALFKDKEDLFEKVVGKPLMELHALVESHINAEKLELKTYVPGQQVNLEDDLQASIDVVTLLFKYKEEYELLIMKAQGSKFESIVDDIADQFNKHYLDIFAAMKGYTSKRQLTNEDKFVVHWMAHDQVEIFIHLLTHCKDVTEAKKQIKGMFGYLIGGWYGVLKNT